MEYWRGNADTVVGVLKLKAIGVEQRDADADDAGRDADEPVPDGVADEIAEYLLQRARVASISRSAGISSSTR